jgi:large subunit ribosomal protein L10
MAITKEKKEQLISELSEKLRTSKSVVFTDYRGLTVEELEDLRNKLREQGIEFKVIKNTLFRIAVKEAGITIDESIIKGHPVAVAFSLDDEVTPAKISYEFANKNEKLGIIGGILEGKGINDIMIKSLAKLPSREELYGKIVGSLASPLSGLVNVLSGNARSLVNVLNAIKNQK